MSERIHRTKDERVAELDQKIAYHKQCIKAIEQKKSAILNPKKKRTSKSLNAILTKAKAAGLTNEEIAEKLGISLD